MLRWCGIVLVLALAWAVAAEEDYANNPTVQLFQEYVRINTTTGNNITAAVDFWKNLAKSEGLECIVNEFEEGYPVIVIKWPGTNSSLGSIMLNSHMDVVPADEDDGWTYPPFSGYLDDDGVIWGRGTQDMKSVSIQYWEALRRLKENGTTFLRDVYMTLMPDEETGGTYGIKMLLASDLFQDMNVGLEMDEGTSYNISTIPIFYHDKAVWQIEVTCVAEGGHSSTFAATNDTAIGKCSNAMNLMEGFRDVQYVRYLKYGIYNAGNYTTLSINKINGGTANNVIPTSIKYVVDIRLNITLNETEFDTMIQGWATEAGTNVTITYILKDEQSPATLITSENPYWVQLTTTFAELGVSVYPLVPPGATDARHVRSAGYPAYGFSPMPNTPLLLHTVNERLSAATLLNGVNIYAPVIEGLVNIPGDMTSSDPSVYNVATA